MKYNESRIPNWDAYQLDKAGAEIIPQAGFIIVEYK